MRTGMENKTYITAKHVTHSALLVHIIPIVLFALMLVLRVFDNEHVLSVRSPDCAMNVTAMTWLYSLLVIAVIILVLSVIGLILSVRARKTLPAAETLVTGNIIIMVLMSLWCGGAYLLIWLFA